MSHVVLKWNPAKWPWADLPARLTEIDETGAIRDKWDSSTAKQVAPGDRVLLLRVGRGPRGIVGMGTVTKPPFEDKHWDQELAANGERRRYVEVEFKRLAREPFVSDDELNSPPFDAVNWFTQAPIIYVTDEVIEAMENRLQL